MNENSRDTPMSQNRYQEDERGGGGACGSKRIPVNNSDRQKAMAMKKPIVVANHAHIGSQGLTLG